MIALLDERNVGTGGVLRRMLARLNQTAAYVMKFISIGETEPEVVILRIAQGRIKCSRMPEALARNQQRAAADDAAADKSRPEPLRIAILQL